MVARRKRRIGGSSSMRTTAGSGIDGRRDGRRGGRRQREEDRDAPLGKVVAPDPPAMRFDDAPADREAETGALTGARPRLVELLEDPVLLTGPESRPVIGDLDRHLAVGRGRDYQDRPVPRPVLFLVFH